MIWVCPRSRAACPSGRSRSLPPARTWRCCAAAMRPSLRPWRPSSPGCKVWLWRASSVPAPPSVQLRCSMTPRRKRVSRRFCAPVPESVYSAADDAHLVHQWGAVIHPAGDSAAAGPEPHVDLASWEAAEDGPGEGEALVVALDGFEGPLDVLLILARTQKVDLAKISVRALAEQYLLFITEAQKLRLELAADYLVMAAWLAYLKSRLLLPRESAGDLEPTGEELAARLAFRLQRLEAMRTAAATLMTRKRLGRDIFGRGMPEGVRTIRVRQFTAAIYDLLKAYADQRKRTIKRVHVVPRRVVWSIKEARDRLQALVGKCDASWVQLDSFLQQYGAAPDIARTALASSFGATLEMAREGLLELSQAEPFAPIYVRKREDGAQWQRVT